MSGHLGQVALRLSRSGIEQLQFFGGNAGQIRVTARRTSSATLVPLAFALTRRPFF